MTDRWPDIPFEPWKDSSETLHQWLQIVGKFRLAHTPGLNPSWHECPEGVPRVPRVVRRGSQ